MNQAPARSSSPSLARWGKGLGDGVSLKKGIDMTTWKEILKDEIPAEMGKLIDTYEAQMELRKQGKLDEKIFAEARLRKGGLTASATTMDSAMTGCAPVIWLTPPARWSKVLTPSGTRPVCSASKSHMAG